MFSLLLSPLGRSLAAVVAIVVVLGGVYFKIRSDAIAQVQAAATADALRRMGDAIRAGDSVDTSAGGLRQPDGHNRD